MSLAAGHERTWSLEGSTSLGFVATPKLDWTVQNVKAASQRIV